MINSTYNNAALAQYQQQMANAKQTTFTGATPDNNQAQNENMQAVQTPQNSLKQDKVKKKIISFAATAALIVGLAGIANKGVSSDLFVKAGQKVDDIVKNSSFLQSISKKLSSFKETAGNALFKEGSLLGKIKDVLKPGKRIAPKNSFAKMSVLGPKGIFSLTPPDVLEHIAKKADKGDFTKMLKALIGNKGKVCGKNIDEIAEILSKKGGTLGESSEVCKELVEAIKKKHGLDSSKKMADFFSDLAKGKIGKNEFDFIKDVKMNGGLGGWFPLCKGNLGDALKKYTMATGQMADTSLGRFVQKASIIPAESITNCVNDKSFFGIAMGFTILPQMFDAVQTAEKGKRKAVVADNMVSTVGNWAISMPLAGSAVYGAASLAKLQGTGVATKSLRGIGKFLGAGLNGGGKVKGFAGGLMRLALVMGASGIISKPITKATHAIFGKPETNDENAIRDIAATPIAGSAETIIQNSARQARQQNPANKYLSY